MTNADLLTQFQTSNAVSAETKGDIERVLGSIGKVALEIIIERARGRKDGADPTVGDVLAEYERAQAAAKLAAEQEAARKKKEQTTLIIVIVSAVLLIGGIALALYMKKRKK